MAQLGQYMTPGFPGMKSSAEDDNVQTFVTSVDVAPGLITHSDAAMKTLVPPTTSGSVAAGLVLFDGEYQYQRAFQASAITGNVIGAKLPANVLRKGKGWATVSTANGATCTPGKPVKYSTDGTVSDQGTLTLPGAVFRTAAIVPTTNLGFTTVVAEIEMNTMLAGQTPVT
jgi:hypothetical protein